MSLAEAVALLAAKGTDAGAPGGGKVLGDHPNGGAITLRDGRFGAYVSHGKTNATLPKDMAMEDVTLADAVDLINAKGGGQAPVVRKAPAAKKAAPAAKPPAAKKKAPVKKPVKKAG